VKASTHRLKDPAIQLIPVVVCGMEDRTVWQMSELCWKSRCTNAKKEIPPLEERTLHRATVEGVSGKMNSSVVDRA
jgi:hypothetical protein